MHVYLVDEGGLSLLLRRVHLSAVISLASPAYLIMHDKRVTCLFSEISTLCSVAMEQSYVSLIENFMGCLIVAVYCYFLIFFYTVVYTFLSVCVCLPFSLSLSLFIQPFRKSLKGVCLRFLAFHCKVLQ